MNSADAGVVPRVDHGALFYVDDGDAAGADLAAVEGGVNEAAVVGDRGEVAGRVGSCEIDEFGDGEGAGVDECQLGWCAAHADDQGALVFGEQQGLWLVADLDLRDDGVGGEIDDLDRVV